MSPSAVSQGTWTGTLRFTLDTLDPIKGHLEFVVGGRAVWGQEVTLREVGDVMNFGPVSIGWAASAT